MRETIYNTEFASITFENGIISVIFKKGPITIAIAKEIISKRLEFCQGEDFPLFISDTGNGISSLDRGARELMGGENSGKGINATAFFTDSPLNKYIINFFLRISNKQTKFPTKIFSNQDEAIKWLENFAKKK